MIFAAGSGKSVSWLDNVLAQDDKKEAIGVAAIGLDELKKLAQFSPMPQEADVKVEEAVPAAGATESVPGMTDVSVVDEATSPVPTETPVSDEIPEAPEETGEQGILQKIKDLLDADDLKGAKMALEEALGGAGADQDVAVEAPADEAEIPVTVGDDGDVTIDEKPEGEGEVVSVEIEGGKEGEEGKEDKSDESETAEHEAAESPEFEAGEKEEEGESKAGKKGVNPFAKKDKEEKAAGSSSRFYKVAFLSPENKKKLADYWKNALGYDPEYVNLMTTDYEKRGKK
jgi:hypothetical protein